MRRLHGRQPSPPQGAAPRRQRGIALLALLALVVLALGTVLVGGLNSAVQSQSRADQTTARSLREARDALVGWALTNPNFPGGFPFPDRNGDGVYDGFSDCTNLPALPSPDLRLGRIPWRGQTVPCQSTAALGGLSGPLADGSGAILWYGVSLNLLRVGNGAALVDPQVNWPDPLDTPAFPWLTVRDAAGNVVSDRVAFVVLAPGAPVFRADLGAGGQIQDRTAAAPGNPANDPPANAYLDRYVVPAGTPAPSVPGTYDNADNDGDFIQAPDNTRGPDGAPVGVDGFNDRLLFVTVDELQQVLARRVLNELATALRAYRTAHGAFPWPAWFEDPGQSHYKSYEQADGGAGAAFDAGNADRRYGFLPLLLPTGNPPNPAAMGGVANAYRTPFTVQWRNMSNANLSFSGTVTAAHLNSPGTFTLLTPPVVAAGDSNCRWERIIDARCANPNVDSSLTVTGGGAATAPWGAPCAAGTLCVRRISLLAPVDMEQAAFTLTAPNAGATRRRQVRDNFPTTPNNNLSIRIEDVVCPGTGCTGAEVPSGVGELRLTNISGGEVLVGGMRHELMVLDETTYPTFVTTSSEVREYIVRQGWHRRILYAVAEGHLPGGAGACMPGTDCLEVDSLDAAGNVTATVDDARAVLVFSGISTPAINAAQAAAAVDDPARYYEYDNDNGDRRFTRATTLPVLEALRTAADQNIRLNDQLVIVQ